MKRWKIVRMDAYNDGSIVPVLQVLSQDRKVQGWVILPERAVDDRRRLALCMRDCRRSIQLHRRYVQRNITSADAAR